eukprot:TRINITY_DN8522_c0_g1_i2.p1 TRINITY_DN8522_c0_g1~~TRINITY_DN8522_c0_g1_i2.p1  ORF type:complete len:175 (-),score=48.19 TRINITY_DN8522_c0_g1_i2:53-577(-)
MTGIEYPKFYKHEGYEKKLSALTEEVQDDGRLESCILKRVGKDSNAIHLTQLLSVVLCNRGECEPNKNNTILLNIMQSEHNRGGRKLYSPYVITYFGISPFSFRSISPLVMYAGLGAESTYSHSITWYFDGEVTDKNIGYLNDKVIITLVIREEKAFFMDVRASDLLKQHRYCE